MASHRSSHAGPSQKENQNHVHDRKRGSLEVVYSALRRSRAPRNIETRQENKVQSDKERDGTLTISVKGMFELTNGTVRPRGRMTDGHVPCACHASTTTKIRHHIGK